MHKVNFKLYHVGFSPGTYRFILLSECADIVPVFEEAFQRISES